MQVITESSSTKFIGERRVFEDDEGPLEQDWHKKEYNGEYYNNI